MIAAVGERVVGSRTRARTTRARTRRRMGPREDAFGSLRKVGRRRHRRHRRGEGVLRQFGIVSVRTSLRALFPPSLAFAFAFARAVAVQDLQGFADALFGARGERGGASRGARVFRCESARFFVDAPRGGGGGDERGAAPRFAATRDAREPRRGDGGLEARQVVRQRLQLRRAEGRRGEGGRDEAEGEAERTQAIRVRGGGRGGDAIVRVRRRGVRAEGEVVEGGGGGGVAAGGGDQGPPRGEVRRERVRRGRGRGSRRSRRPPSVVLGAPAPAPPVARGGGSSALRSREDPDARVGAPPPLRASRHVHVVGDALPLRRGGHPGARGSVTPARQRRWAARDAESSERKMDFSEAVSAVSQILETAAARQSREAAGLRRRGDEACERLGTPFIARARGPRGAVRARYRRRGARLASEERSGTSSRASDRARRASRRVSAPRGGRVSGSSRTGTTVDRGVRGAPHLARRRG